MSSVHADLQTRYGLALLSRVTRHRDGQPDLSSVPGEALAALAKAAASGRDIPEPPGEVSATHVQATFGAHRLEVVPGPGGETKTFTVASMRWYGGDTVRRYRFDLETWEYEPYDMVLSMDDESVDLSRLNSGAPFLSGHRSYDSSDVLGVIVDGSAVLRDSEATESGREGVAEVRFSRRPEVQSTVQDVLDGILRQVSQGFDIEAGQWEERKDDIPLFRVTRWAPFEVSLVPLGAAASAQFLSAAVGRSDGGYCPPKEGIEMPNDVDLVAARKEAAKLEAERQNGIRLTARTLRLSEESCRDILADTEITLDEARARLISMAAERDDRTASPPAGSVSIGTEESEKLGQAMVRGLLHRYRPEKFTVGQGDPAAHYQHRTLIQLAEECLQRAGAATNGMSRGEIARRAMMLGRQGFAAGMHSTSDFPLLLADVASKAMRAAYDEAPQTWRPFCRVVNLPDFKTRNVVQMGEAPTLEEIAEGGEYTYGTMGEGRAQWSLSTYGRMFALTRQVVINDDLDAFTRLPALFGASARNKESDIVWALLTGAGADIFHANFSNLATAEVGGPDADALAEAREAMRNQKGLDGSFFVNLVPRYLLIGPQYETAVDQLMGTFSPTQASNVVPNFIRSITPIVEPRLDASSSTAWFLAADPGAIDTIEAGWLQGSEGVQIETRNGWEVDGLEIKARLDFGAKLIDRKAFFKNAGA